jgi:hypothetical protein
MMKETKKEGINWLKVFFWGSYLTLLGVSTPHMAYFFASFTDASWQEWGLSYAAASAIEASIYISSWAIYKLIINGMTWKKFLGSFFLFLWIVICMSVSWLANSAHAAHFRNAAMLSGTQNVPLSAFFVYIAGGWPFFGLIFSFVSKTATQRNEEVTKVAPIDDRTPEQILVDAEKQRALMIAKAKIDMTRAQLDGRQRKEVLKSGIGSFVGGTFEGIKDSFAKNSDQIQYELGPLASEVATQQEDIHSDQAYSMRNTGDIDPAHNEYYNNNSGYNFQSIIQNSITPTPQPTQLPQAPSVTPFEPDTSALDDTESEEYQVDEDDILFDANSSQLWNEVKVVDGSAVKYTSWNPYFRKSGSNGGSIIYASIKAAYQEGKSYSDRCGGNLAMYQLTREKIKKVVDERRIDPKYLRYVRYKHNSKMSIATTIAIHETVRDALITAIRELESEGLNVGVTRYMQ